MKDNLPPTDILIANLRSLMRETKTSKPALAKKSGVSERMIAYIFSKDRTPTVEVMDALAGAFGLKGWQLLIPGIKVAVAGSGQLDTLIKNYTEASEQGKNFIMRVAEKEAKYEK